MILNDGLLMRTPAYQPLESPLNYVLRLSEANGYHTPTIIMELAASGEDWRAFAKWDYAHLNKLLPACRHTPPSFVYRRSTSTRQCDLSLLGHPILSRHLNALHAGVCPKCVEELGFAPAWWDLRYAVACPTHRRVFIFRCPGCGRRLYVFRRGLLTCSCGATLNAEIDEQPSVALLWLMDLLKHKTESRVLDIGSDTPRTRPLRPEEASLATLCTIIESIGRAEHRMTSGTVTRSVESQRSCLPTVAAFLYDWPNGVFPFCARWHQHKPVRREECRDLRVVFPWAFQGLFANRHERRRDTLFVIDAVLQYVSSELPGWAIGFRAHDLQQLSQDERAYCGTARAAELSGVPRYTITRMIRRKRIPYRVSYHGTRPAYEIKTEVARKLRIAYEPALLFRDGSRYLGVTHNVYRDLRHAGVIEKRRETMMPESIAIRDLEDFKRRVIGQARMTASREGLESLDQLRLKKCPRGAMVKILKHILQGSIRSSYIGRVPKRINDLLVRPADVAPIIARFAPKRLPTMRELQARHDLSCSEARTLVRCLSNTPDSAKKISLATINVAKLDEFMSRYRGLSNYARSHHVGYRAALSYLLHADAEMLQMPVVNRRGRFVYFVQRQGSCPIP